VIGALGLALPLLLLFVDKIAFHGDPFPRDSLSVYYYSGMREVFVVALATTGFFLIAYKITEKNLDNTLSVVGGIAAIMIPLFPTARPPELRPSTAPHDLIGEDSTTTTPPNIMSGTPLTPLQDWIGEDWTKWVHFGASAVFIAALGGMSILFARREAEREAHGNKVPANVWRVYHFICAGAIGAAAVWIIVTKWFVDGPYWSLFAGEAACAAAFGASWFMKGAEIDYLRGRKKTPDTAAARTADAVAGTSGVTAGENEVAAPEAQ
jgi:hypothetical protein